jgi:hypothetical protein
MLCRTEQGCACRRYAPNSVGSMRRRRACRSASACLLAGLGHRSAASVTIALMHVSKQLGCPFQTQPMPPDPKRWDLQPYRHEQSLMACRQTSQHWRCRWIS